MQAKLLQSFTNNGVVHMSEFVKQQTNKRNINFLFILKPNSKSPQRYIQLLCGDIYLYNQNHSHKQALYPNWSSFLYFISFSMFSTSDTKAQMLGNGRIHTKEGLLVSTNPRINLSSNRWLHPSLVWEKEIGRTSTKDNLATSNTGPHFGVL